ncbi:MAG: hypothetical protein GF317_19320 [Candidatus Lokiarchaeota archaeon]|nr:hypothetical protein [Candidatus Lokiarchaeota archaeon]MBD3201649.1 hypothetical protein [Candidatus Lokiarchaeota archaeon]
MSLEDQNISDFINEVKSKLPEWLRTKPDEMDNILFDLKQQIRIKAEQISGNDEPDSNAIKQAIYQIGPANEIVKLYKKRGTPKVYITQELWDLYLRSLLFSLLLVVVINFLTLIFQILFVPWYELLGSFISGSYIGFLIATIVVTGIFVYLSMEGYLPEDFGDLPRYLGIMLQRETKREIKANEVYQEPIKSDARIKLDEAKATVKEEFAEAKEKVREAKEKAKKDFRRIKVSDLIAGTILGTIFGIVLIIQPFYSLHPYFETEFLDWLRIFGLIIFIGGLIDLVRLAIGVNNIIGQKISLFVVAIYNISFFPMILYLINRPDIFPIYLLSGFQITTISPGITMDIYMWVGVAILIILVISIFVNVYKAVRLGEEK